MFEPDDVLVPTQSDLKRVRLERYPRAAAWDPTWQLENMLGTNPLWLTEELMQHLDLQPGMRVLDLGCGRGMSSLFLAKELQVQVWAADLWMEPDENWQRVEELGLEHLVYPIQAEAHTLPFAGGFFDAIICVDAWHLFGLGEGFVGRIAHYLRDGGLIGMISPGLVHEFENGLPGHVIPFWQQEFWSMHSPEWWTSLWQQEDALRILHAEVVPEGWKLWLQWEEIARDTGYPFAADDISLLQADAGQNLGFISMVAQVNRN